jgi:D-arabinose 1-dehydrogenase-like Zn-dependent alcohol dehydrogenase
LAVEFDPVGIVRQSIEDGVGGGVACAALQFAVATGAKAWATSSSREKIERARSLGAEGGAIYRDEGWAKSLARQSGPPDLIIEGAGGPDYEHLIEAAAPGGRIVNFGATAGPPSRVNLFKVFWKQLRIQGSTMGSPKEFKEMLQFAETHKLKPVVEKTFPLEQINEALETMRQSSQFGKITIDCWSS